MTLVIRQGGKTKWPSVWNKRFIKQHQDEGQVPVLTLPTSSLAGPGSSSGSQRFPLLISKTSLIFSADQSRVPATVGAAREVDRGGVKSSSEFLLHPLFRLTEGKISVLESEQC